ncbi:MAG: CCA tRNA nucleotidyltransferase [Ruminococcus sp.]|nr:CCA tRNA nucleotidyltransferase [Ruminococcus sp.]
MVINIPDNVSKLLSELERQGFEAYIVGGCVRDGILGKPPADFDIATSATPEEIKLVFESYKTIDTGIKHGTVTVIADEGTPVEVTSYRIDGTYTDNRRPDDVVFTRRIEEDLSRRDFTVNAMAYSPKRGFIDIYGGAHDLFAQTIRCVGDPEMRFGEDALRILRALRFASKLRFTIDADTAANIHRCKDSLMNVSAERIGKELELFLVGSPTDLLIQFSDVISVFIPEIQPCVGFEQHSKYHVYDVWKHTATAVGAAKPDRLVRLALLFHDLSKPECYHPDSLGAGHFSGHEKTGAALTETIMRRLKFDNATVETVTTLVRYHYVAPVTDRASVKKILSEIGFEKLVLLTEVIKGDNLAKHAMCFERVELSTKMREVAEDIVNSRECYDLSMLETDGNEIAKTGATGKEIGKILRMLLDEVIEEELKNNYVTLQARAAEIYKALYYR